MWVKRGMMVNSVATSVIIQKNGAFFIDIM